MTKKALNQPSLEEWQKHVSFDKETGTFTWKHREGIRHWNTKYAGKQAGCIEDRYTHIQCFGKTFTAHRIVWLFLTGEYPVGEIDHINGDQHDNRPVNLRDVSHRVNARNVSIKINNKSGVPGVYQARPGKWVAQIRDETGKLKHLGVFDSVRSAASARKLAESLNGYHPNNGRKRA